MLQVRLYRPFSADALSCRAAGHRSRAIAVLERTKEPGAAGRAALSRRRRHPGPGASPPASARTMPRVIGGRYGLSSKDFTPAMVEGGVRRARQGRQPKQQLHRRHQRRCLAHQPDGRSRLHDRAGRASCAPCSTGSAPTARSAPTRTASRSSPRTPAAMRRAISSMIRTNPARRRSRICASGREPIQAPYLIAAASFVACHQFGFLERHGRAAARRARRDLPPQQSLRPGRGVGSAAASGAAADHRQEAAVLRHRRLARSRGTSASAGASTPCCRPASSRMSGVLPREEAIAHIKESIRKTYGRKGEDVVGEELRRRRPTLAQLSR